ncbi:MAG: serine/threonine-protein kinase [Candidatus Obscuribacterales bacterium]
MSMDDDTIVSGAGETTGTGASELFAARYRIEALLGKGGMSTVHKAEDIELRRRVALKLLHSEIGKSPAQVERFKREARALAALKHEAITPVYATGLTDDGEAYLVMELIEGLPLSTVIKEQGPLPEDRAISVFEQIALALEHAHEKGVLHRDLKPSNVLIHNEAGGEGVGRVSIIDFGIAKLEPEKHDLPVELTVSGEIFGSPRYMSPEQCRADDVDHRCDIYALGCLMYETVCGKPPFEGTSVFEVIAGHLSGTPRPLSFHLGDDASVSMDLELMILRCLMKDPDHRPPSMRAIVTELSRIRQSKIDQVPRLDLDIPDILITALHWSGDPHNRRLEEAPPTDLVRELDVLAGRLMELAPQTAHVEDAVRERLSHLSPTDYPDLLIDDNFAAVMGIADYFLASGIASQAERLYRRLIEVIPERFVEISPERLSERRTDVWLRLADCVFKSRTRAADAQTLYSAYLFRSRRLGLPEDELFCLRLSRLADCHLIEESFKLAENAYEEAREAWLAQGRLENAAIAELRGAYASLRRNRGAHIDFASLKEAAELAGSSGNQEAEASRVLRELVFLSSLLKKNQ